MPRESQEALNRSEDDEGDQSASETRAPVPVVVRDQQIQTRSQGEVQTGQESFHLGGKERGAVYVYSGGERTMIERDESPNRMYGSLKL